MNQKKRKDEEKIKDERFELWRHIFFNDFFEYAHRTNDEKYNNGKVMVKRWQIYGEYSL